MRIDTASLVRCAALVALAASACAHHAGKQTMEGAVEKVSEGQEKTAGEPEKQVARVAAQRAVAGALAELDAPAERERLRQLVDDLVRQAVSSAFRSALEPSSVSSTAHQGREGASSTEQLVAQAARSGLETALRQVIADLGPE